MSQLILSHHLNLFIEYFNNFKIIIKFMTRIFNTSIWSIFSLENENNEFKDNKNDDDVTNEFHW